MRNTLVAFFCVMPAYLPPGEFSYGVGKDTAQRMADRVVLEKKLQFATLPPHARIERIWNFIEQMADEALNVRLVLSKAHAWNMNCLNLLI